MNKKIALAFFSGAGGLDMGIHQAGFDVRLSLEIENKYCETLKLNHPDWNIIQGDIMDYTKEKVFKDAKLEDNEEVDLIIGGSPCQSFSTAGKRQAFEDIRGMAMIKYIELIEEIKPKVFILENVKGLLSAALKHRKLEERGKGFPPLEDDELPGSALKFVLEKLKHYNVSQNLVNSADYGVPQKRERVFIIGIRKDLKRKFVFPKPTHSKDGKIEGTEKWVTVEGILKRIENDKQEYVNYSEERLKYMKMIPKGGGNWRDLPEDIVKDAMGGAYNSGGGKVGFYRRIKINEPSPTLLTSPIQKSTNIGHPYEDRPLSIQEYLAIQGFPIDYKISGNIGDKYTQIGNAVPVQLAYVIGCAIFDFLKK